MPQRTPPRPPAWLALLVTLLTLVAAIGLVVTVSSVDDDGPGPHKAKPTIRVELGGPKGTNATPAGNETITVPESAIAQAKASDLDDHEGLKTEDPVGATRAELNAAREQQDRLAQTDALPVVTPDAAPEQRGCTTRLVRNYSSRRGVRPRLLVAHYTVSPNRPGWSDVFAVTSLFDTASFQASSNYVIDDEGHCAYIVRESDKAWAQAAANPVSISTEIIATGREGRLSSSAGLAKIGQVFADAAKRWDIPLSAGKVSGCTVVKAGIVDHHALGACGGGHFDVSPYSVTSVIAAARKAAGAGASSSSCSVRDACHYRLGVLTAGERQATRTLLLERRVASKHGGWSKVDRSHVRRAQAAKTTMVRRRAELKRLGLTSKLNRAARYRTLGAVVAAR